MQQNKTKKKSLGNSKWLKHDTTCVCVCVYSGIAILVFRDSLIPGYSGAKKNRIKKEFNSFPYNDIFILFIQNNVVDQNNNNNNNKRIRIEQIGNRQKHPHHYNHHRE